LPTVALDIWWQALRKTMLSQSQRSVKYWEIIADNLHDGGFSLGWVSTLDFEGRTIWIVDAHRGDGKRFIARSDEKLTAFVELETAILHLRRSFLTSQRDFCQTRRR
jgi:hypothetical protein